MPPFSTPMSPFPGSRLKENVHTPWLVQPWMRSLLFLTYNTAINSLRCSCESCPKVADAGPRRPMRGRPGSIVGWTPLTPSARLNAAYTLLAHARSFHYIFAITTGYRDTTPASKAAQHLRQNAPTAFFCGRCPSSQPNNVWSSSSNARTRSTARFSSAQVSALSPSLPLTTRTSKTIPCSKVSSGELGHACLRRRFSPPNPTPSTCEQLTGPRLIMHTHRNAIVELTDGQGNVGIYTHRV